MEDPLRIGRHAEVPLSEIELGTSRSSGPGGQHTNVTASRVQAVFDVSASQALSEEQRQRISARLGPVVRQDQAHAVAGHQLDPVSANLEFSDLGTQMEAGHDLGAV